MSRTAKLGAIAAAAATVASVAASAPAAAYSVGPFSASLQSSTTLNVSIGGSTVATCTASTLSGSITAATATTATLQITSASISGCGVGVTPANLPWTGTISGGVLTITGFRVNAPTKSLCIHCNKCMPTIFTRTHCHLA